jgi:hypothetical protein
MAAEAVGIAVGMYYLSEVWHQHDRWVVAEVWYDHQVIISNAARLAAAHRRAEIYSARRRARRHKGHDPDGTPEEVDLLSDDEVEDPWEVNHLGLLENLKAEPGDKGYEDMLLESLGAEQYKIDLLDRITRAERRLDTEKSRVRRAKFRQGWRRMFRERAERERADSHPDGRPEALDEERAEEEFDGSDDVVVGGSKTPDEVLRERQSHAERTGQVIEVS